MKTKFAKYGDSIHIRIPAEFLSLMTTLDLTREYDIDIILDGDEKAFIIKIYF
jgi:antitoxin component of MazEF toxin-antitoxin module